MKSLFKLIVMIIIVTLSQAKAYAATKKIHAKCYVELFGGERTIVYQILKQEKFKKLEKSLKNKKLITTLSDKKQKVYSVLECVENSEMFTSDRANFIEKTTAK